MRILKCISSRILWVWSSKQILRQQRAPGVLWFCLCAFSVNWVSLFCFAVLFFFFLFFSYSSILTFQHQFKVNRFCVLHLFMYQFQLLEYKTAGSKLIIIIEKGFSLKPTCHAHECRDFVSAETISVLYLELCMLYSISDSKDKGIRWTK